jgi:hypothetical protein
MQRKLSVQIVQAVQPLRYVQAVIEPNSLRWFQPFHSFQSFQRSALLIV